MTPNAVALLLLDPASSNVHQTASPCVMREVRSGTMPGMGARQRGQPP